jgi:hypothetical protein
MKPARLAIALLVALAFCTAARAGLFDCIDATCRVVITEGRGQATGTGCLVAVEGRRGYVLTNAHVIGRQTTVRLDFWPAGAQRLSVTAQVVARQAAPSIDTALLVADLAMFGNRKPVPIPLANPQTVLAAGTPVFSVGCPGGSAPSLLKCRVLRHSPRELTFSPWPELGRSGSAIFTADGSQVVAVIHARSTRHPTPSTQGVAISVGQLLQIQCPPSACPPGWRPQIFQRPGPERSPGTQPLPPRPIPQAPVPTPTPAPPGPNLAGIEAAVGQMAEAQREAAAAQSKVAEALLAIAKRREAEAQEKQAKEIAEKAGPVIAPLISGDFAGARDAATSPGFLSWAGYGLAGALVGLTGIGGLGAVGIRIGIPIALRVIGRMLARPENTAADDLIKQVKVVAKKR